MQVIVDNAVAPRLVGQAYGTVGSRVGKEGVEETPRKLPLHHGIVDRGVAVGDDMETIDTHGVAVMAGVQQRVYPLALKGQRIPRIGQLRLANIGIDSIHGGAIAVGAHEEQAVGNHASAQEARRVYLEGIDGLTLRRGLFIKPQNDIFPSGERPIVQHDIRPYRVVVEDEGGVGIDGFEEMPRVIEGCINIVVETHTLIDERVTTRGVVDIHSIDVQGVIGAVLRDGGKRIHSIGRRGRVAADNDTLYRIIRHGATVARGVAVHRHATGLAEVALRGRRNEGIGGMPLEITRLSPTQEVDGIVPCREAHPQGVAAAEGDPLAVGLGIEKETVGIPMEAVGTLRGTQQVTD